MRKKSCGRSEDGEPKICYHFTNADFERFNLDRFGTTEPANPEYPVIRLKPGQALDYFGKVTACIHRFSGKL